VHVIEADKARFIQDNYAALEAVLGLGINQEVT